MAPAPGFTEIPTIDLSLADEPSTLPVLLDKLRVAITEVGFLYISNHGIPARTIDHLVQVLPKLFQLSDSAKSEIALENSPHFLGYSSAGTENTAGKADQREQVEYATELDDIWKPGVPLSERLQGPNQWPTELPELQPIVEHYITELTWLSERFLTLVARALSLHQGTFLPYLSNQHRLKLVHYPPPTPTLTPLRPPRSRDEAVEYIQGVGPHKDSSGWWTFLLQASPPEVKGLQVLNKAGDWIDVPNVPGTFVVNIGQAFEAITHGVCRATTHRVVLPTTGTVGRFSVPFFQGVRRNLTKEEALEGLREHFEKIKKGEGSNESEEASSIDLPFLRGDYGTWGEAQLRTKIRSHRENGKKFYPEVYDKYINDGI